MKKIIYIRSSNIYDDSRATKEIEALLENCYRVVVIGWNRDGKAEKRSKIQFQKYDKQIEFCFFQSRVNGGIGIRKINLLLAWLIWVKKEVKKVSNVDAIHACNLDSALTIWHYAEKKSIKRIYDIYDYYVDSHSIPGIMCRLVEKLENNIINNSELTIICTEERKEQIKKAHPKDLVIIYNSPEIEEFGYEEEKYDYVYCGSLFSGRLIKEIFDGYSDNKDISFCIAGYGTFTDSANDLMAKYDNFHYFGSLAYKEVLFKEKQSKIISAIYEPNIRNHRLCAPNKFYEALALAKPVIVCKGTGIDKIVEDNNIGIVIDYNVDDFYNAVRYLKDNDDLRQQMGTRARDLYIKEYRWDIMRHRLLKKYSIILGE